MAEPLHISLDDLHVSDPRDSAASNDAFEVDVGNLCVFDPRPIKPEEFENDVTSKVAELAAGATRALLSRLSQLPRPRTPSILALPPPTTPLPRSKPLPTSKPLTRWEAFAKSKGIRKKKRDKRVWDEGAGEWRRRYGYKRVNDTKDVVIMDAKPTDKPGESPFEKVESSKKERREKQSKRELRNAQRAVKKGHLLPSSVQLVADLPKHGKGHPMQRKEMKDGIDKASRMAGLSTASMGKFDARQKGEAADERISKQKKRSLVNTHELGEKQFLDKMSERLVKEHSENVLNLEKAMGRLEADKRRHRHQEKIDEEIQGKKKPRSQKKTAKRKTQEALPKLKVTSRQKKLKKRNRKTN